MKRKVKRLTESFGFALEGIHFAFKYNQNLWIHTLIALLVILASIYFKVNPFEMGILGIMILLVISLEMLNTTIEQMVDLIIAEHRKEAKIAKDVSAAMVLLAAIGSMVVGTLIFAPYLKKLFF